MAGASGQVGVTWLLALVGLSACATEVRMPQYERQTELTDTILADIAATPTGVAAITLDSPRLLLIDERDDISDILLDATPRLLASAEDWLLVATENRVTRLGADGRVLNRLEIPGIAAMAVAPDGLAYRTADDARLMLARDSGAAEVLAETPEPPRAIVWCANALWLSHDASVVQVSTWTGGLGATISAPVGRVHDLACSEGRLIAAGDGETPFAILDPAADANFTRLDIPISGQLAAIAARRDRLWIASVAETSTHIVRVRLD
jgi:hypothetical protein